MSEWRSLESWVETLFTDRKKLPVNVQPLNFNLFFPTEN